MLVSLGLRDLVQTRRCNCDECRQVLGLGLAGSVPLVLTAVGMEPFIRSLPAGFLSVMALGRGADLTQGRLRAGSDAC